MTILNTVFCKDAKSESTRAYSRRVLSIGITYMVSCKKTKAAPTSPVAFDLFQSQPLLLLHALQPLPC